ncbi:MAG TPA: ABC transporter substrate-binding protein [Stellaceae bacterium]|nr:ABC transporter substrate-binding protein [Stellaceae bacterium]
MAKLPFTFACGLYDRMVPLYTGEVQPAGLDLNFIVLDNPRQIFDRMAGGLEFDASEMSSSETFQRHAHGNSPFVALPVFPSRVFRHGHITINRKSGIKTPKDLEGRRVGVPLYTQTAAIFIRGMLQHEYGVDCSTIHWVQGALNDPGTHGNPSVLPLLKPAKIEQNRTGKSLSDLLEEGAIDAITATGVPNSFHHNPDIVRLFPNYREVERDYFRRTRIFPIMHLVAMRRDTYEKHPFVATSLYEAFEASKNAALARMKWTGALRYMIPWLDSEIEEIAEVFDGDPWPYGIEANRPTLEALVQYLAEQNLIAKPMPIEQFFVPIHGLH